MRYLLALAILCWAGWQAGPAPAQQAPAEATTATRLNALGRLPVREVSVFKDGHAFLIREGSLPVDPAGTVSIDQLPRPVLGTFWAASRQEDAPLLSVTAGKRRVQIERTALEVRQMIEANAGRTVRITERGTEKQPGDAYDATILETPSRSVVELAATRVTDEEDLLPEVGNVAYFQTERGVRPVPFDSIQSVVFDEEPRKTFAREEFRNLLTLRPDWKGKTPPAEAKVEIMYLERGIRWIPSYKVVIDGAGQATLQLQATVVNELIDLQDATVHLVIGVPSFKFQDQADPIALQQAIARVAAGAPYDSQISNTFSNAIMTQQAMPSRYRGAAPAERPLDLGPETPGGARQEDLYLFTLPHVTLRKGERLVMPVAQYKMAYRDVYTLDIPILPPTELRASLNNDQQREMARLMAQPKVMHKIRLSNRGKEPLTTAPALILKEGRVLAQGMMTYTPAGAEGDLSVTNAMDIAVKKSESETKRDQPTGNGPYKRVDLKGELRLANHLERPVDLEVSRSVFGSGDEVDNGGGMEQLNLFDYQARQSEEMDFAWWGWYNWPWWWNQVNGITRMHWKITLKAGQETGLNYGWHYLWRD